MAGIVLVGTLGFTGSLRGVSVSAQDASTTDVTIVIVDDGTLDVHWGDGGVEFLASGANPEITAVDSAHTTATFSLIVHDTRADGNRAGYSIAITSTGIGTEGEGLFVGPGDLVITDLDGLPEGADASTVIGSTLASPVTVVSIATDAPAVDTVVSISMSMTIPAGSAPGTYSGGFTLDVLPVTTMTGP